MLHCQEAHSFLLDVHVHEYEPSGHIRCQPGPTCPRLVEWCQWPRWAAHTKSMGPGPSRLNKTITNQTSIVMTVGDNQPIKWAGKHPNKDNSIQIWSFLGKFTWGTEYPTAYQAIHVAHNVLCPTKPTHWHPVFIAFMPFSMSCTLYGLGLPMKSSGRSLVCKNFQAHHGNFPSLCHEIWIF